MILLIPYWISDRERLGRILIVLSSWCIIYAGHSSYMSAMKRQFEAGVLFPLRDQQLLSIYINKNIALFLIIAAILLIVGLALILLLKKWAEKTMKITGIILLPVILISGLIGLEIIGSRLSDQPENIIWQAREMMHGRLDDNFGSNRGWIWRNAVEVIPDNPIFGTGPDTFYHALGAERQLEAAEKHRQMHDRAHNIFLQIAVCMGIPALIAYLIFLGSVFVPAIRLAFKRPILLAFGAAALSYIIQSFFSIEGPIVAPLLWIALGVTAGEVWMAKIGYKSIEL
jgi:putative inorganic carbon (HCO3(-)) transporter